MPAASLASLSLRASLRCLTVGFATMRPNLAAFGRHHPASTGAAVAVAHLQGVLEDGPAARLHPEGQAMIREDRELMAELDRVTKQIVNFTLGILGADPVSIEAQRYLGKRMIDTGT